MRSLSLARQWRLFETALSSWGWAAAPAASVPVGDPEPVREAMCTLAESVRGLRAARLLLALRTSTDLRGLWYQRGALMQVLAAERGESAAAGELARIDALFRRAWPQAPVSRASVLG